MAVYIRPARVVVDEDGGGVAAVAAVAVVAGAGVVVGSVLGDIVLALGVAAVVAVAGSLAVLVVVLRRGGRLYAPVRPAAPAVTRLPALPAGGPAAISGARPAVIPGWVLDAEDVPR